MWCTSWSLTLQCDAHLGVQLRSVMHILESSSAVWWHLGVWLSSVMHIFVSNSIVWCTSWSLTQQSDDHLGVWLSSVNDTVDSDSRVIATPWNKSTRISLIFSLTVVSFLKFPRWYTEFIARLEPKNRKNKLFFDALFWYWIGIFRWPNRVQNLGNSLSQTALC